MDHLHPQLLSLCPANIWFGFCLHGYCGSFELMWQKRLRYLKAENSAYAFTTLKPSLDIC